MMRDERISELLADNNDVQKLARLLLNAANDADGEGNASVIVARVQ
jgi:serine/threonine protein phosphatase PrpC